MSGYSFEADFRNIMIYRILRRILFGLSYLRIKWQLLEYISIRQQQEVLWCTNSSTLLSTTSQSSKRENNLNQDLDWIYNRGAQSSYTNHALTNEIFPNTTPVIANILEVVQLKSSLINHLLQSVIHKYPSWMVSLLLLLFTWRAQDPSGDSKDQRPISIVFVL